jgi:prephenate dehydrogenase
MTSRSEPGRAQIVGTGLIGGSIGLALRARGWTVTGTDSNSDRAARALEIGALDALGDDPDAQVIFVATPVAATVAEARKALTLRPDAAVVTDVAE